MVFSATWFLLEQEGLLAQACLCNGLTALRRANLGDKKGLFYSAFFELSIGFERTLKLILILDHMARNQLDPPDSKTVEDYGHKLRALFDSAKAICATRGVPALDAFQPDSLPNAILGFLDDFAHPGGRYSNINKLTGHKHQAMADPLVKWGEIASRIMNEHATPGQRKRAELNGQLASAAFGDAAASLRPFAGDTRIFIAPGYRWQLIDALVTNFHLPESTLLMLVSALAGRGHVLAAYAEAVAARYRFFSYGDAMFVTRHVAGAADQES